MGIAREASDGSSLWCFHHRQLGLIEEGFESQASFYIILHKVGSKSYGYTRAAISKSKTNFFF
jgi:hypothetical protein